MTRFFGRWTFAVGYEGWFLARDVHVLARARWPRYPRHPFWRGFLDGVTLGPVWRFIARRRA
jgi:hypothetical protein